MAGWEVDGDWIYSAPAPTSWTSLDLKSKFGGGSTSHPTARTLALLRVTPLVLSSPRYSFRPNGSSMDTEVGTNYGHGCCCIVLDQDYGESGLILVPTDSSGIVEWTASTNVATSVYLVGFIEATVSDQIVRSSTAMPTDWTSEDLTTDISLSPTGLTGKAFAYVWFERTDGNANEVATRPSDPGRANYISNESLGGCSQGRPFSLDTEGYVQKTNSSGEIEIIALASVPHCSIELASFDQTYFEDFDVEVFAAAPPPTTYQDLDLSTQTNSRQALVMIEVHYADTVYGTSQITAFRGKGDTAEYAPNTSTRSTGVSCCYLGQDERTTCLVQTDADGVIQWKCSANGRNIDLRVIGVLPTLAPTTPAVSAQTEGVILSSSDPIKFRLEDDNGIDMSTFSITAIPCIGTALTVYTGGAWAAGWDGTVAESGAIYGSNPTRVDVSINSWHDDFTAVLPKRWTISVAATNIVGVSL